MNANDSQGILVNEDNGIYSVYCMGIDCSCYPIMKELYYGVRNSYAL